jgi:YidC/Oxa1 family membrane protein insertase
LETLSNNASGFKFYFGPNHYLTLRKYKELELDRLIHLGWSFLGWINRFMVIPVFNFLEQFIGSYGIIILILTILIKLVLFPLTYKSYLSTAKMKVLKPQIDEINSKIPKEKAMERQQAMMGLYKKAGVNPMGGCLPMLLQMPILIALFQFFPASIELRGEPFLWATDLSSYDSILQLPFNIPFYGDHVSLFCLLMAITNIVYTHMNQEMAASSQQMPGMKTMMYMMPVMFLFFFNSYASGLSYYYFISTLFTIGQTLLFRKFVNEKALLAKIHAHQKKPVKKSGFQQRLEDMARQQQLNKRK